MAETSNKRNIKRTLEIFDSIKFFPFSSAGTGNTKKTMISEQIQNGPDKPAKCLPYARYVQAWLAALGLAICFGSRTNLPAALLKMMSPTPDHPDGVPEFQWSPETVSIVDRCFSYAAFLSPLPAGLLSARYLPANKNLRIISSAMNVLYSLCPSSY